MNADLESVRAGRSPGGRPGLVTLAVLLGLCVAVAGANAGGRPQTAAVVGVPDSGVAPVIISPEAATGVINQSFNYQIVLANFQSGTYAASGLPAGLTLDAKVGVISGTPPSLGTFTIALSATNANGTGTATLTLTVIPSGPPDFTSATIASGQKGKPFSFQTAADNYPASFSAAGLPAGLFMDAATGLISGTPTAQGDFNVALSAVNVRGTGRATLSLAIAPADLPVVTLVADEPSANARQGVPGSFVLARTGDTSEPLVVAFAIKGTAENGVDYQQLPLTKSIKVGKSFKRIMVRGIDTGEVAATGKTTVKLILQPSGDYVVGSEATAKVKIYYAP